VSDPQALGSALRRERERRGISLDEIAARTKIAASLFDGLERGDLSRWPGGIFRRAFVRNYAQAVGLEPEPVLEAFLRACPEDEGGARPEVRPGPGAVRPRVVGESPFLRLTLADDAVRGRSVSRCALAGAALDGLAVIVPGLLAWLMAGPLPGFVALLVTALLYPLAGTALLGTTPGAWAAARRFGAARRAAAERAVASSDVLAAPAAPDPETDNEGVAPLAESRRPTEAFVSPRRRDRRTTRGPTRRHPDGRVNGR
jgi:transcriptional regulator with XRE-family HTH domain